VNNGNIKNKDPLQLQQIIIFLKCEIEKYKNQVESFKDSDYYSLVENLEEENRQVLTKKNELIKRFENLEKKYEKQMKAHKEILLHNEMQNTSIEALRKTKEELWTMNKQLTLALENSLANKESRISKYDFQKAIDQLELRFIDEFNQVTEKMNAQIEKFNLANKERAKSEEVITHLENEIKGKNNTISSLEESLIKEKERSNSLDTELHTLTVDAEILKQLDTQIRKLLAQSFEHEENLEAKLKLLNEMEYKLDELSAEINNIKAFTVKGHVLKDS